jgi:hypothetical protein
MSTSANPLNERSSAISSTLRRSSVSVANQYVVSSHATKHGKQRIHKNNTKAVVFIAETNKKDLPMTQPEMNADQAYSAQIAKARGLMTEALALLDDGGASLPAIYLDQALAALANDLGDVSTKR